MRKTLWIIGAVVLVLIVLSVVTWIGAEAA
jgi:hypothetical protein